MSTFDFDTRDEASKARTASSSFRQTGPELPAGLRFRVGKREYGRLDQDGFVFHRSVSLNAPVLDTPIDEVGALRFRWGRRELARWSHRLGLVLSRVSLPGLRPMLLPREAGRTLRLRIGNRELGRWSPSGGMLFHRQTLPADVTVADAPGVALLDRLGGGDTAAIGERYIAYVERDARGIGQVATRRLADGSITRLTAGAQSSRSPVITADDRVLYWSEGDARLMYAAADTPGAIGPAFPSGIVAEGDSLTAGAGSNTAGAHAARLGAYPAILAQLLGQPIANRGVGGQTPREISARDNGNPALLTLDGNAVPAAGTVAVTAWSISPITAQNAGDMPGTVAGVHGFLRATGFDQGQHATGLTFTRTDAGAAVPCPAQSAFTTDVGISDRPARKLFTLGRNDPSQMIAETAKVVAYQSALYPDYLVGAYLTAVGQGKPAAGTTENQQMQQIYGDRWVDLDSAPTAEEMAWLGFVPDSYGAYSNGHTDADDIANGWIPSGMRWGAFVNSADFLHLNDFGYGLWALRYYRAIRRFGWLPNLPLI